MTINTIVETSYSGMYKLTPDQGPAFFIRPQYIPSINFERLEAGALFNEEESDQLLDAGLACVVELKAVEYLARAEQSRFGLNRKLLQKKYEKKYVGMALDFLESKNYLSDQRFARAWLHGRRLNHYEGKSKLLSELQSRGISKEVSLAALEEFFTENDEMEICRKAWEKFIKKGKEGDKLIAAMMQAGFTYKMIKAVSEEE